MRKLSKLGVVFATTLLLTGCKVASKEGSTETSVTSDDFSELESLSFSYRLPDDFNMNDVFDESGEMNDALIITYQELTEDQFYTVTSFAGDVSIVNDVGVEVNLGDALDEEFIHPNDLLELTGIHQRNEINELVTANEEGTQIHEYEDFYLSRYATEDEGIYKLEFSPKFTEEHMNQLDVDIGSDE